MPKNLVIVESPAKAKTIAKFLGKDYEIKSSFGHIRDLPKKDLGVDIKNEFEPTYQVSPDKKDVASELKKSAKGKVVWLASDEDREGEAIAWHICSILGLDPAKTNRIVFHEITKPAITEAVAHPRTIDRHLVDAQQARRILDRLVGYELSPVLWKKVRAGLSAGRVQSVAVRLIVEREREIKAFQRESTFKISAVFVSDGTQLEAELPDKLPSIEASRKFLDSIKGAAFSVTGISQKPGTRSPSAPFTTSTLQQEAARRLGYSVRQTMTLAQRLYENGHITYMRTDSTSLSNLAINAAKQYIAETYGEKYAQTRQYKTKSRSAQEAHEAIRPTSISKLTAGSDNAQKKLYELIWKRTVASQMAAASTLKTEVSIAISGHQEQFVATGEVLTFDGFLKVYGGAKDDQLLPELKQGQALDLLSAKAEEVFSRPPARYSEASLVKKLEQLGIGRPSTYAPTISTIQARGYAEKKDVEGQSSEIRELVLQKRIIKETTETVTVGADRAKLLPSPLADVVTDFLIKYFSSIIDYDFTAHAEEEFDDIADGKIKWREAIKRFYEHFHPLVKESEKADRAEAVQARKLGKDPKSGKPILVRYGRFGPVLQMGEVPEKNDKDAEKPRFAPLPEGAEMDSVTLEQALPMFNLPREVGKTKEGELITADIGRFGPYIKIAKQFISIKGEDPAHITEDRAREIIKERQEIEKQRVVADFGQIKILRGPYGPYVTDGKKNARIPKEQAPEKLTQKDAQQLLDKAPAKKGARRRKTSR